ncbi:MAG: SurA N-terminal domain-containing protein [Gammaproteobacteria bacterium]
MLQLIRDKAQGIIIWIIVGLVILALSSFILNSYLGSSVKTYVAKVNDQTITQRDYQMAFNSYEQRMRQMLGKNFAKFYNEKMMRQTVIDNLVRNALMQQLTRAAGFRTSDLQVANVIKNTPAFKQDGKFSQKHYKDLLARVGYTPSQYESDISHDQSQQQFEEGLSGSAFILKSQAQDYLQLELQQRNVDYLLISMSALRKNISVSDKDIKDYYDSHLSAFMTKEQVQVSYLNLDKQALARKVKVSDAELQAYYNNHKASYTSDDYAAAKKKIEDIAARIRKGASFAEMAKKYSQDPGSARKGGDLGFFSKGMMVKPFQEAAFKLKVGQISKPIRTKFGYHLIKLIAIRDDGKQRRVRHILIKPEKVVQPFAKVKSQIVRAVQLQHADKIFYQDADKLDRLSYEYQDSLDPAAEKLNEKIQVSPFFSRQGGAGIWGNPDVIKAAFSDDVLKGGLNSDLIKISDDHMLVLRLKQHKPATQKPLADVKQQIETLLKKQRASAEAAKLASKYVAEIKKGEKPDKLAAANNAVSWTQAGYIGRKPQYDANQKDKVKVPAEIRKQAFLIGKPQDKQPVVDSEQLANGDAAVIILSAIRDKPGNKDDKQVTAVQQQLLQSENRVQRSLLLQYQRAHSKIDIVKEKDSDQDS